MGTLIIDSEFTSLKWKETKLITLQVGFEDGRVKVYDMRHKSKEYIYGFLSEVLAGHTLVAHNASADLHVLAQYGFKPTAVYCTMLTGMLLQGRGGYMSLAEAVLRYAPHLFDKVNKEVREVFKDMDKRPEDWNRSFTPQEMEYMENDIHLLRAVYEAQQRELRKPTNAKLVRVVDLENSLLPVVVAMEEHGLYVDKAQWSAIIEEAKKQRGEVEERLQGLLYPGFVRAKARQFEEENAELVAWVQERDDVIAGARHRWELVHKDQGVKWGEFKLERLRAFREETPRPQVKASATEELNLGSHVHLRLAFKESWGLELASTAHAEIEAKVKEVQEGDCREALASLLDYKAHDKLINAFGEGLLTRIGADSRLYPRFNQLGTDTGRFSCSDPLS